MKILDNLYTYREFAKLIGKSYSYVSTLYGERLDNFKRKYNCEFLKDKFNYTKSGRNMFTEDELIKFGVDFAKYHTEKALQEASNKAYVTYVDLQTDEEFDYTDVLVDDDVSALVSKDSILKAYPLTNIK